MKRITLMLALVACQSPQAQPDGGRRDGYVSPCAPKPAGKLCTETCGNGVVDDCLQYGLYGEECLVYSWTRETCDRDTMPCTALGYYGGTAPCYTSCNGFSPAACEVCPPDAELCAPLSYISFATGLAPNTIATSGTGVIDVYDVQGTAPVQIAELAVPTNNARTLTAVPGGWIVVSSTLEANFVSDSGVVGPTTMIPVVGNLVGLRATYAANRVFVSWSDAFEGVQVATLDTSGALVAGPIQVHPSLTSAADFYAVATDGTALFVSDHNRLAKVAADGTIAASTTFALDPFYESHVTCDGTTCWFLAAKPISQPEVMAQRFDANATLIGMPVTIASGFGLRSFLADGNGLLALSDSGLPLRLARIDSTGTIVGTKTVAAASWGRLFHLGARIVVQFAGHVAVVTPP